MSQFVVLDSGPLGLLTHPQRSSEVVAVTEWLSGCLLSGARVIVPAIVHYELKRELLRAQKTLSVGRLDAFVNAASGRYLPLSDEALRLAAELWTLESDSSLKQHHVRAARRYSASTVNGTDFSITTLSY